MAADIINNVITQARLLASHSWEYGTLSEALLEWYNPEISVFSKDTFPNAHIPVLDVRTTPSLSYAITNIRTNSTTLVDGDGAAGDPASLGVLAILIGQTKPEYLAAAERQVNHMLDDVPRAENGAISHRGSNVELWADFIYMVPPTLAYWAVQTSSVTLLNIAIEQCNLYREALGVPVKSMGEENVDVETELWRHIRPGRWEQ